MNAPEACVMCLVTSPDASLPLVQATVVAVPWIFRSDLLRLWRTGWRRLALRRRAVRRARRERAVAADR